MVNIDFDEHGGNVSKYSKDILDFSANINPLGLSKEVKKIFTRNLYKIHHYPDPESKDLISGLARYWKISEENILLGNGSSELFFLISFALRPKNSYIPIPSFSEYEKAVRLTSNKVILNSSLKSASKKDLLIIGNPNNPTGSLISVPAFNGLTVIDEAFMDFLQDEKKHTLIWKAVKNKKYIVIRTFTKFFAIPGLRLGYLIAHKELISFLRKYQVPWNINIYAQQAGQILLKDRTFIKKTRLLIEKERKFLFKHLSDISELKPFKSAANFILIKIKDGSITSSVLKEKLIKKKILIRDCSNFKGLDNTYFRIAVRKRQENVRLIKAINEIL